MKPEEFATVLLSCRDILHVAHLRTTSFAAHKALNGLYDSMLDHLDNYVEIMQADGLLNIKSFTVNVVKPEDIVEYLEDDFMKSITDYKSELASDMTENGHIVNLLEDITSNVKHTLYKLKFLK